MSRTVNCASPADLVRCEDNIVLFHVSCAQEIYETMNSLIPKSVCLALQGDLFLHFHFKIKTQSQRSCFGPCATYCWI